MDWIASLSIERVLEIAFFLTFARLGLVVVRNGIGLKAESFVGEWVESLLLAWVVVFLFVRPLFFDPFKIPSPSMVPTLNVGDRIVVNKYEYRFHSPQRGDVIVFKSPPTAMMNGDDFVKRLIGLPGDTVDLRDGHVFINGTLLAEPFVCIPGITEPEPGKPGSLEFPYKVPANRYLMMGDNRGDSFDSRGWGVIEPWRIQGKVVFKFWPLSQFGALKQGVSAYSPSERPALLQSCGEPY